MRCALSFFLFTVGVGRRRHQSDSTRSDEQHNANENAPTIRADISTYNVSSKAAWLGLGCRCRSVLAGSVAEGAKPACALHQKKPRSCRRPRPPIHFRYSCGALPQSGTLPSHTHPTTSIAHPGSRVTVASDPTRPQARSRYLLYCTVQFQRRPQDTPRENLPTHRSVASPLLFLSLSSIGFINLPSKTFIVLCSLVPCLDSFSSLFQLCSSSAAICSCSCPVYQSSFGPFSPTSSPLRLAWKCFCGTLTPQAFNLVPIETHHILLYLVRTERTRLGLDHFETYISGFYRNLLSSP